MDREPTELDVLLQRARDGCPEASQELVVLYGPHLRRAAHWLLRGRLRSIFNSVDFTQMVWLSFFAEVRQTESFTASEHLIGFLVGIVRNKIREQQRRLSTQRRDQSLEVPLEGVAEDSPTLATSSTPLDELLAREGWEQFLNRQAPGVQRILREVAEGRTEAEVAGKLGVEENVVHRLVRVAIRRYTIPECSPLPH